LPPVSDQVGLTLGPTPAAVTVNPVDPLIDPEVAWIVVLPAATAVAKPPLAIVATAGLVELQVTVLVRFSVLPSL
jgi:hypothetical protein